MLMVSALSSLSTCCPLVLNFYFLNDIHLQLLQQAPRFVWSVVTLAWRWTQWQECGSFGAPLSNMHCTLPTAQYAGGCIPVTRVSNGMGGWADLIL